METLFQDLRYGLRFLVKSPKFTTVAVLCLALGIGVNTAMFSFVDAVLLKPLAYKDADRLVNVYETSPRHQRSQPSPPTFLEWRELNTVFSQVAAYRANIDSLNMTSAGGAERIQARFVSANYLDMLPAQPTLGRAFRADEDQPGHEPVAVIS